MGKKKRQKRTITEKEKDMKKISGRLLRLFKDHGYDVEKDCHAISRLVSDMENKRIPISNGYTIIHRHVFDDVRNIESDWIKYYCDYFGCSADYILGYISNPTHEITEINKKTGLSTKAIINLLTHEDYKIVTNKLLETDSMNDFVQALTCGIQFCHTNNFIENHIPKNLPGITQTDLDIHKSNQEAGNKSQIDQFAIMCFDKLLKNPALNDYFDEKAVKRYMNNLDSDLKNKRI